MKQSYKYLAVFLVVSFGFMEVTRDVHYVLHHRPQGVFKDVFAGWKADEMHACCALEIDSGSAVETVVTQQLGRCPYEHVKWMPFRSSEPLFFRGRTVFLKQVLNALNVRGIIKRMAFDHRLRAPPLNDAYS